MWINGAMVVGFTWLIEMAAPNTRDYYLVSTTGAIAFGGIMFTGLYYIVHWQMMLILATIVFAIAIPGLLKATESFRFLFSKGYVFNF